MPGHPCAQATEDWASPSKGRPPGTLHSRVAWAQRSLAQVPETPPGSGRLQAAMCVTGGATPGHTGIIRPLPATTLQGLYAQRQGVVWGTVTAIRTGPGHRPWTAVDTVLSGARDPASPSPKCPQACPHPTGTAGGRAVLWAREWRGPLPHSLGRCNTQAQSSFSTAFLGTGPRFSVTTCVRRCS